MAVVLEHTRPTLDTPRLSTDPITLPRAVLSTSPGDSILEMYVALKALTARSSNLWEELSSFCHKNYIREIVEDIGQRIRGGSSLSEAMNKHAKFFGDLAIVAVELGERGSGVVPCIQRYFGLQRQRQENALLPSPKVTSRHTRDFGLVAGTLMELGASPLDAFSIAANDKPRRFRKEVDRALSNLREGQSLDEAFDPEYGKGHFRFKFDRLFLRVLQAGEGTGKVGTLLSSFGSQSWSLAKL